jgi:chromate reductase
VMVVMQYGSPATSIPSAHSRTRGTAGQAGGLAWFPVSERRFLLGAAGGKILISEPVTRFMIDRLLLVSGSLRRRSTNTSVLRTLRDLAPFGLTCVLYERLGDLPHFNPDADDQPLHPVVADLRTQIHHAGAIVFSTPEYAGALPGSFKNLLDWAIGDDHPHSIHQKPVAWINASPRGATAAHDSLRSVLHYANAELVESACIDVSVTASMINEDGLVVDPAVREALGRVCIEPGQPS